MKYTLSWVIEIWMKNHVVSDRIVHCKSIMLKKSHLQGITNNVRFGYGVSDATRAVYIQY